MSAYRNTPSKHNMPANPKPVVLIVRDGWGHNPNPEHDAFNAIKLADTPCNDALLARYPSTRIHTSSRDVGLPDGTMGNSEVGHQNIGAGRIVYQESVRISLAIEDESFYKNAVLNAAIDHAKANEGTVHLLGIASDAGVHGLMSHLYACLEACARRDQNHVALHLFTDGRDTGPFTGIEFIRQIEKECNELGVGWIASICGRYYAMDRDNRWERVKRAYDLITGRAEGLPEFETAEQAIQDYYDNPTNDSQQGDEFITPRIVGDPDPVKDGDAVIFYNYRGDRPREITRAFVMPEFYGHVAPSPDSGEKGFDRGDKLDIVYVTMTAYQEELNDMVNVAFPKAGKMVNIGGDYLAQHGKTQFRCAETEKFPHVTFFFNDYREEPFPGEGRQMAQSPKVATYDLKPEMSANEVCDIVLSRINADDGEDMIIVNFANGDMVGHTGSIEATVKAVETVDRCVGLLVDDVLARGGAALVTADHGNAEQMIDPATQLPHTAHTTFDVDLIVVDAASKGKKLREGGRLADVAPTLLDLLGLPKPAEMTGESLIVG
jgi:2,3-bisphosphoglycerate-independent phosphoglycerate mutase